MVSEMTEKIKLWIANILAWTIFAVFGLIVWLILLLAEIYHFLLKRTAVKRRYKAIVRKHAES